MGKAACKCAEVECEECPEWIFTLADLIMVMMGLFVLMWVLKPGGSPTSAGAQAMDARQLEVIASIREALGYVPDPKSNDPIDLTILMRKLQEIKSHKGPGEGGPTKVEPRGVEGDQPEVMTVRPGKQAIVGGRAPFAPGQAVLTEQARRILDEIVPQIKGKRNVVLVKGHAGADDFPEGTSPQVKSDLSIQRAKAARDYLVEQGVEPDILRVYGSSTFEPVSQPAYTPELRQLNRRVEVESTTTLVPELQDRRPPLKPVEAGRAVPATVPAGQ